MPGIVKRWWIARSDLLDLDKLFLLYAEDISTARTLLAASQGNYVITPITWRGLYQLLRAVTPSEIHDDQQADGPLVLPHVNGQVTILT